MNRRTLVAGTGAVLAALSGCTGTTSSPLAHTVSVYLSERDETHDVTVLVENERGEPLFEREYRLSDANEADEDATFPASTDPATVVVTVDGTRFDYQWPGFEADELPCEGENRSGLEVYVGSNSDGSPDLRLDANCQYVTVDPNDRAVDALHLPGYDLALSPSPPTRRSPYSTAPTARTMARKIIHPTK